MSVLIKITNKQKTPASTAVPMSLPLCDLPDIQTGELVMRKMITMEHGLKSLNQSKELEHKDYS